MLWRWKWLFLVVTAAVPVGAAAFHARFKPAPVYVSSALLQVETITVDTSLFEGAAFSPRDSIESVARRVPTTRLAKIAAKLLHPPPARPRSLLPSIRATPDLEAGLITITALGPTGRRAADVANAFAFAVVRSRADRAVADLNRTIAGVKDELSRTLVPDEAGRRDLSRQLQQLRALRATQGFNAEVVDRAIPSDAPVPVTHRHTMLLAIILGLMLAGGAVYLAEAADRRLRSPSEFE
ncbi:MAG: hypothetical protein QOJ29_3566, partial [Thermoleophilaceae bacterium]|nr:hypothetical protein [Thermoleophilaceae bacterium]